MVLISKDKSAYTEFKSCALLATKARPYAARRESKLTAWARRNHKRLESAVLRFIGLLRGINLSFATDCQ